MVSVFRLRYSFMGPTCDDGANTEITEIIIVSETDACSESTIIMLEFSFNLIYKVS